MIVSMLCILRDQGLPLPAGGILISPWVDLTHSFPSMVRNDGLDYIPAHGFHQKPSAAWPPPNDDEMAAIRRGCMPKTVNSGDQREAKPGVSIENDSSKSNDPTKLNVPSEKQRRNSSIPGPDHQIAIEVDGKMVVLKDQIQFCAHNQLISHPLVSPVLQPSLGGLPPLFIMTGGGELLRDEQIYLAHKATNPQKHALGDEYRAMYDPGDTILNKYPPTPVQLQVWEDLCHVTPTLSFTRPAKFMYRSIAQFGAWALARAQKTSIELTDDDNISMISSGSDTDSDSDTLHSDIEYRKKLEMAHENGKSRIGKAGDPLPIFINHMIRQRVDRHGQVYELQPAHDLSATSMHRNEVGVVKAGPVRAWMVRKKEWDTRYAKSKRKVQQQRAKELLNARKDGNGFGSGEVPPPSALASRTYEDTGVGKQRKSMGLAMWSGWGSKHDESTLKREERAASADERMTGESSRLAQTPTAESVLLGREVTRGARRASAEARTQDERENGTMPNTGRGRRRTIAVTDTGQADGGSGQPAGLNTTADQSKPTADRSGDATASTIPQSDNTAPIFIPKFKSQYSHLRDKSMGGGETSSIITTDQSDTASTTAVFSAPGIIATEQKSSILANKIEPFPPSNSDQDPNPSAEHQVLHPAPVIVAGGGGTDSPRSARSLERLS